MESCEWPAHHGEVWAESNAEPQRPGSTYHVIAWKELLEELRLLVHHGFDDELIIAGDVEEGAAGPGVGQLDQGLVA